MSRLTTILAIFGLGLLLGLFLPRFASDVNQPAPPSESSAKTKHTLHPTHDSSPASAQTGRTSASRPAANDASFPIGPTPTSAGRRPLPQDENTVRIPRKFFSKIQCFPFNTASNCISDDIVELLNISPTERERLDRLIATTRDQIEAHELERAAVTEQTSTSVVLKIAANPDIGRDAATSFAAGVQATLGDRAASFLERAQPYESTLFSNFGQSDTILTVTRDDSSNLLRVQSQLEYTTPNGGHGSVSSTTMANQLPNRWQKFFQAP